MKNDQYAVSMDRATDTNEPVAEESTVQASPQVAVWMDSPTMGAAVSMDMPTEDVAVSMDTPTTPAVDAPVQVNMQQQIPSAPFAVMKDQADNRAHRNNKSNLPFSSMLQQPLVQKQPPDPPQSPVRRDRYSGGNRDVHSGMGDIRADSVSGTRIVIDQDSQSRRKITLKEMENKAKTLQEQRTAQWKLDRKRWFRSLWISISVVIAVVLLALLVGAFLGSAGIILVLILFAGTVAILGAMGKLKNLAWPKKPEKVLPVMDAPNIDAVFPVRLRLRSMNIARQVEITVRQEEQILGRDQSVCYFPLDYKGISRIHCTIISHTSHGHTEYFIRDENSKNGTKVNGADLEPSVKYPLKVGDTLTLAGRYEFKVCSDAM